MTPLGDPVAEIREALLAFRAELRGIDGGLSAIEEENRVELALQVLDTFESRAAQTEAELVEETRQAEGWRQRARVAEARLREVEAERDARRERKVLVEQLAQALREAEATVARQAKALKALVKVAPAPPWFNTDTREYVAALDAARAVLAEFDHPDTGRTDKVNLGTEASGRIVRRDPGDDTSTPGFEILGPEAAATEPLNADDLAFESWGRGHPRMDGSVSLQRGVRVTHLPTGTVVEYDEEKSQLRNKEAALKLLAAALPAVDETYPEGWLHATIHLNPKTGEMHSDGDHRVRLWIKERLPAGDAPPEPTT